MPCLDQFIRKCHDNLLSEQGESVVALQYLQNERHLKSNTILINQIGYCNSKDILPDEIKFFGKSAGEMLNGNGYNYFIQGKVILPVFSEFGKIVGFATRTPSSEPDNTWWNLSLPFHKSHHLFLLDKVRKEVFENNKIYLVEGYIDAIVLRQEGLKGIVSVMGTNLSPRTVGLIARYCNNVCVCLDVDENKSGQKGQDKIIYILKKFDFCDSISVIEGLPVKEDPDVFVIKNGVSEFLKKERKLTDSEINCIYKKVLMANKGRK